MKLEFCFEDQIKEAEEHPLSFELLYDIVTRSFGEGLSKKWILQHLDSNSGLINLNDEKNYQMFLSRKLEKNPSKVRITVVEQNNPQENSPNNPDVLSFNDDKDEKEKIMPRKNEGKNETEDEKSYIPQIMKYIILGIVFVFFVQSFN